MLLHIFSVFDSKAAAYLPPFFERAEGSAVRAFQAACNDEKHAFFKSSEDYTLFNIGVFDDATGHLEVVGPPRPIVTAAAMKATGI